MWDDANSSIIQNVQVAKKSLDDQSKLPLQDDEDIIVGTGTGTASPECLTPYCC